MDEYISRKDAIKELHEVYEYEYPTASGDFDEYASHYVPNILKNIPAADVQLMKHGRWEGEHYNELIECYEANCSECGYESADKYRITDNHRYCEYCGARMDLKDGDTNE
jgi:hypothetical protein